MKKGHAEALTFCLTSTAEYANLRHRRFQLQTWNLLAMLSRSLSAHLAPTKTMLAKRKSSCNATTIRPFTPRSHRTNAVMPGPSWANRHWHPPWIFTVSCDSESACGTRTRKFAILRANVINSFLGSRYATQEALVFVKSAVRTHNFTLPKLLEHQPELAEQCTVQL